MVAGCKKIPLQLSIVMEGDDSRFNGRLNHARVPVLETDDGNLIFDSNHIVTYLDKLSPPTLFESAKHEIILWCLRNMFYINRLTLPRIAKAQFAELSTYRCRQSFIGRKSKVFGYFPTMLSESKELIALINDELSVLFEYTSESKTISATDLYLFPLLNLLTIVKDLTPPAFVRQYISRVSLQCKIKTLAEHAL